MKFGLIGLGLWGKNYLRVLQNIKGLELAGACDRDYRKESLCSEAKIPFYTDPEKLISLADIDAYVVATPPDSHFELGKAILKGRKHLLVEKPVCLNWAQTKELCALAGENKCVFMAGHILEYHPIVVQLRSFLEDGLFGKLCYIYHARTNLGTIRTDTNVLWDLAVHDIAVLRFLLREDPLEISAWGGCYTNEEREDIVFIKLAFPGGVLAHLHISWLDPLKVRKITLVGDKKMAVFDDLEPVEKIRIYDPETYSPGADYIYCPRFSNKEPLIEQCQHFVECITGEKEPETGTNDILWVSRVAEAAQRSLKNNGFPVRFEEV